MTLSVQDVTVRYGGRLAVDHVDLEVADGEVVAVVGESGCGKTSLARALVGLLPADVPRVAESGVDTPEAAARLARAGYELALIGSALMTSEDPGELLLQMVAAGRAAR